MRGALKASGRRKYRLGRKTGRRRRASSSIVFEGDET